MNITCSALPEQLLESELFGHERGAFTDARTQKKGLLETADGGTVFLDEIGEMTPALQAKLLRFLEEKSFKRVGGSADIRVDVRVIAATNRNLEEEVENHSFRADLFFRLNVLPIVVPPLRVARRRRSAAGRVLHRRVQHRVPEAGARSDAGSLCPPAVLRMAGQRARAAQRDRTRDAALRRRPARRARFLRDDQGGERRATTSSCRRPASISRQLERSLLVQALRRSNGNQTRAGALLGLNRDQIRYRIEKFGLARRRKPTDAPSRRSMTNEWPPSTWSCRDGSTVCLRRAVEDDIAALVAFLEALSPDSRISGSWGCRRSRQSRVRSAGGARREQRHGARRRIAADASSPSPASTDAATHPNRAEVAFAVADALQGHGIGTRLLERLASLARAQGIDTFDADVLGDNRRMLDVFRDSGFAVETRIERGDLPRHVSAVGDRSGRRTRRRPARSRRHGVDEGVFRTARRSRSSAPTASAARSARRSFTT